MISWLFAHPPAWFEWAASIATLVGLAVAITQLARTRKAAEAAKLAALEVKNRLGAYDFAVGCGKAVELIRGAIELCGTQSWSALNERLPRIQDLLADIRDGRQELSQKQGKDLQSVSTLINNASRGIGSWRTTPPTKKNAADLMRSFGKKVDLILEIQVAIRKRTGEST